MWRPTRTCHQGVFFDSASTPRRPLCPFGRRASSLLVCGPIERLARPQAQLLHPLSGKSSLVPHARIGGRAQWIARLDAQARMRARRRGTTTCKSAHNRSPILFVGARARLVYIGEKAEQKKRAATCRLSYRMHVQSIPRLCLPWTVRGGRGTDGGEISHIVEKPAFVYVDGTRQDLDVGQSRPAPTRRQCARARHQRKRRVDVIGRGHLVLDHEQASDLVVAHVSQVEREVARGEDVCASPCSLP